VQGREGLAKGRSYFGHKEKSRQKSNDTGAENKDRKAPRHGKEVKEALDTNGLCAPMD